MRPLPPCFICRAETQCSHREAELIGWYHAQDALKATETPAAVVPMPEPDATPEIAPVAEIRRFGRELRRKRGW